MSSAWTRGPAAPALIALASAALYLLGLDRYPHFDELYHVLAAEGWLATGQPMIAQGLYPRDLWLTRLIAWLFGLFGSSLEVARLPSLLAIALLNGALFVWVRREAGLAAAAVTTGLFALSPIAVEMAQFARGYAVQMLGFFLAATAAYALWHDRRLDGRAALRIVVVLAGLGIALAVQIATVAGIAGLALWLFLVTIGAWLVDPEVPAGRRVLVVLALLALAAAALGGLLVTGKLAAVLAPLAQTNLATAARDPQPWYYHLLLLLYYPTLWSLVPLLALAALAAAPRPALLALCVFAVGLLVHSIAAAKNLRYFAYLTPFLFVLWGIGLAAVWRRLVELVRELLLGAFRGLAYPTARALSVAAVSLTILFVALANAATVRTVALLADVTVPPEVPAPRWERARPLLEAELARAEVVVTTSELEQLHFLGRYDVLYSRSRLAEIEPSTDFTADFRTGRPVIGSAEALATLMACFDTGLVVSPAPRWRSPAQLDEAAADLLVRDAEPIELPGSRLVAYRWSARHGTAAACPTLPTVSR